VGWSPWRHSADEAAEAEGHYKTDGQCQNVRVKSFPERSSLGPVEMRVLAPCDADLAGTADNVVGHDAVDTNASEMEGSCFRKL